MGKREGPMAPRHSPGWGPGCVIPIELWAWSRGWGHVIRAGTARHGAAWASKVRKTKSRKWFTAPEKGTRESVRMQLGVTMVCMEVCKRDAAAGIIVHQLSLT